MHFRRRFLRKQPGSSPRGSPCRSSRFDCGRSQASRTRPCTWAWRDRATRLTPRSASTRARMTPSLTRGGHASAETSCSSFTTASGPMLPIGEFDDAEAMRGFFATLCTEGAQPRSVPGHRTGGVVARHERACATCDCAAERAERRIVLRRSFPAASGVSRHVAAGSHDVARDRAGRGGGRAACGCGFRA